MTTEDRERYEDDYGYTRGRCSYCHRTVWSDTSVFECSCGHSSDEDEDESE